MKNRPIKVKKEVKENQENKEDINNNIQKNKIVNNGVSQNLKTSVKDKIKTLENLSKVETKNIVKFKFKEKAPPKKENINHINIISIKKNIENNISTIKNDKKGSKSYNKSKKKINLLNQNNPKKKYSMTIHILNNNNNNKFNLNNSSTIFRSNSLKEKEDINEILK